jgi:hypothetical protein
VPDEVRALLQLDAAELAVAFRPFVEAEVDSGGVLGEQDEVDALAVPGGARRV